MLASDYDALAQQLAQVTAERDAYRMQYEEEANLLRECQSSLSYAKALLVLASVELPDNTAKGPHFLRPAIYKYIQYKNSDADLDAARAVVEKGAP